MRKSKTQGRQPAWLVLGVSLGCTVLPGLVRAAEADESKAQKPPPASKGEPAPRAAETLPPVVVQSARPALSKQVLSGAELGRVAGAGNDPMRALQALPGVVAASDSDAAPAIRGSRPGDNLYYVDFLPVGYAFHLGGYLSTVHGDLVQQFELHTGAFGPEFGDVNGGIVDIRLRAPRKDRVGGKLSGGLLGADLLVEGPVSENQSFFFAAKQSYLDLLIRKSQKDDDSGVLYKLPRYGDYQGRFAWTLQPGQELSFYALGARDAIKFSLAADETLGQQQPALVGNSSSRESSHTEGLVWDARFSPQLSNKLAIGHLSTASRGQVGSAVSADIEGSQSFLRDQVRLRLGDAHELSAGGMLSAYRYKLDLDLLDARCTEFDPQCDLSSAARKRYKDEIRFNYATLFLKDRWQISEQLAATAGIHYTRDSYLHRNIVEPRLGLEWRAMPSTTVSLAYGEHNQPPEGPQVLRELGNPGLAHVRSRQTVLGVQQSLADGWSWKAELYDKRLRDFIVADPRLNYVNGGSGDARGLELFIKKDPQGSRFSGWASVSLSKARRRNDLSGQQFDFEYDQPVVVNLVGTYELSERWRFGAKWSLHSGNRYTPIIGTGRYPDGRVKPLYAAINSDRLPAYHRLDLRADQKVSDRLSIYYELINAYAHKNISGYSYNADYSKRKVVSELGLMPNVGLEYKF